MFFSNSLQCCLPGPPRASTSPPATGSLATLSLEAEQQLGFPAGAAAGASSLETAAPTVSFFRTWTISSDQLGLILIQTLHCILSNPFLSRCRASPTRRRRWRQEGAVKTRMAAKEGRRRTGGFLLLSLLRDLLISIIYFIQSVLKLVLNFCIPGAPPARRSLA